MCHVGVGAYIIYMCIQIYTPLGLVRSALLSCRQLVTWLGHLVARSLGLKTSAILTFLFVLLHFLGAPRHILHASTFSALSPCVLGGACTHF